MSNNNFVNQNIKPLNTKFNNKGNLEISGCDLTDLAKEFKTPLYVMDKETLLTMANDYKKAFSAYPKTKMLFASKALMTSAIAKILDEIGFGFDVVSIGEIYTLINAGIKLDKVSFNGNNKSIEELEYALDNDIDHISVDNFYELKILNEIAKGKNKIQKIHLRITPGIECHTHEYIQTGQLDSKFGFDLSMMNDAIELILNEYKNLKLIGLHAHIGSQIFETEVYKDEAKIVLEEIKRIKDKFNIELSEINLGGGLGITYTSNDNPPSVYEIAEVLINSINSNCERLNLEKPTLYIEPGRSLVCSAGVSLYTIGSEKTIKGIRKYIAVDGGMADNPRPSMYQAQYSAQIANAKSENKPEIVTIAGKFCESGDILIKDIELNSPQSGDILCVYDTGAYCYSMSSNYNRVLKPAMVLIEDGKGKLIVKRQTLEQLVQNDVI
ncbi:MAG: diaminopimelate decarboxylase [Candidatus Gastranaerophilales bacterium]|nr:diaminopimelate decarboxylase [Candidatus Gastranaerophilales bacterium]